MPTDSPSRRAEIQIQNAIEGNVLLIQFKAVLANFHISEVDQDGGWLANSLLR